MAELVTDSEALFKGRHFDATVIVLCARWYLLYKLSSRDLREMMAERGVDLAHTTILRWVQRYVPEFEKRWRVYGRPVGSSWRVDETYIKVKGQWASLYRAVDKRGFTVDFLLSDHRDIAAATRFFEKAVGRHGAPDTITLDGSAASHSAVAELTDEGVLPAALTIRTNRYLSNLIEQDHRRVEHRVRPMLGFGSFASAEVTLTGIELMQMVRKGQFELAGIGADAVAAWERVLAA
jgi:transposase-like protein